MQLRIRKNFRPHCGIRFDYHACLLTHQISIFRLIFALLFKPQKQSEGNLICGDYKERWTVNTSIIEAIFLKCQSLFFSKCWGIVDERKLYRTFFFLITCLWHFRQSSKRHYKSKNGKFHCRHTKFNKGRLCCRKKILS